METIWIIIIVQALVSGGLASNLAYHKGYSTSEWFFVGFILGILGLIAAAGLPSRKDTLVIPKIRKKCPYCAEMVLVESKVCRYCGHQFKRDEILKELGNELKSKSTIRKEQALDVMIEMNDPGLVDEVIELLGKTHEYDNLILDKSMNYLTGLGLSQISEKLVDYLGKVKSMNEKKFWKITYYIEKENNPDILLKLIELLKKEYIRDYSTFRNQIVNIIATYEQKALPLLDCLINSENKTERKLGERIINEINEKLEKK